MVFQIVSVAVPITLLFAAPWVLRRYGDRSGQDSRPLLVLACVLFFVSWYIPSPYIDGRDTAFVTHVLGGGIFSGLLWLYAKNALNWRSHWVIEAASLFALVSMLGVTNELFEIVLLSFGGMKHGIGDTSWDLLANTLGAALFYMVYIFNRTVRGDRRA